MRPRRGILGTAAGCRGKSSCRWDRRCAFCRLLGWARGPRNFMKNRPGRCGARSPACSAGTLACARWPARRASSETRRGTQECVRHEGAFSSLSPSPRLASRSAPLGSSAAMASRTERQIAGILPEHQFERPAGRRQFGRAVALLQARNELLEIGHWRIGWRQATPDTHVVPFSISLPGLGEAEATSFRRPPA